LRQRPSLRNGGGLVAAPGKALLGAKGEYPFGYPICPERKSRRYRRSRIDDSVPVQIGTTKGLFREAVPRRLTEQPFSDVHHPFALPEGRILGRRAGPTQGRRRTSHGVDRPGVRRRSSRGVFCSRRWIRAKRDRMSAITRSSGITGLRPKTGSSRFAIDRHRLGRIGCIRGMCCTLTMHGPSSTTSRQ